MLALIALLALQEELRVATEQERWSAVRIQVSGKVDLRYNPVGEEVNLLVGAGTRSGNFWSGRFGLRVDATVQDGVTGTIEVEHRSYDDGLNLPLSSGPGEDELSIKQGFIEVPRFLWDRLKLRIGVQRVAFRTRPHDAPFFMDLGEAEGFFSGVNATGDGSWAADRNVLESAGVRLQWTPYEILTVDAFGLVYAEDWPNSADESVYGLSASARVADAMALWLLAVLVSGGPDLEQVWTVGGGWNGYLSEGKAIEFWVEVYGQGGETSPSVDHRAYAFNLGGRWVGDGIWVEAGFEFRSGDEQAGDGDSEAFLSYENQNRFLILESSEFGLDVDTNVVLVRGALGFGPFDLGGHPLRIRIDVGRFQADEGFPLDEWGLETDLTVAWAWNESLSFTLQGAWLAGSKIAEAGSLDASDDTWSLLFGALLKF